jgi:hypothetical protein
LRVEADGSLEESWVKVRREEVGGGRRRKEEEGRVRRRGGRSLRS